MISGGLQHMKLNYDILSRENKAEMAMLDTTTAPNALKKQVICPFKHCMLSQVIPTTDFDHRRFSAPPPCSPAPLTLHPCSLVLWSVTGSSPPSLCTMLRWGRRRSSRGSTMKRSQVRDYLIGIRLLAWLLFAHFDQILSKGWHFSPRLSITVPFPAL